jgi:hypothetical protein
MAGPLTQDDAFLIYELLARRGEPWERLAVDRFQGEAEWTKGAVYCHGCGAWMTLKSGESGVLFWGCSRWPDCLEYVRALASGQPAQSNGLKNGWDGDEIPPRAARFRRHREVLLVKIWEIDMHADLRVDFAEHAILTAITFPAIGAKRRLVEDLIRWER